MQYDRLQFNIKYNNIFASIDVHSEIDEKGNQIRKIDRRLHSKFDQVMLPEDLLHDFLCAILYDCKTELTLIDGYVSISFRQPSCMGGDCILKLSDRDIEREFIVPFDDFYLIDEEHQILRNFD